MKPVATPFPGEPGLFAAIKDEVPGWQKRAYDHFFPLVRGLLVKALGPSAEIDDLVRDTFLRLFENAKRIRSAEGLNGYVVSIAMNLARKEIRRQKRRRALWFWEDDESRSERVVGNDDPKAKVALKQLHGIIETLSTDERLVYVLHHLEGYSLIEASECLGLSLSTAKRRLMSANERVLRRVRKHPLLLDYVAEKSGAKDV
jgi:RNA polymerase sigma-70 factor, ECF subfamily